jgi:hypothetical protein
MSDKKPLRRQCSTVEEDLRFVKAARNRLWRTPKDTPLKQRRKAEKLAQLDEFIAQLEPQAEAERAARKEAARLAQIKANGERHEAERLATVDGEPAQPLEEQPKQRIAFDINGRHFIKSGERLAEISAVRAEDGSWTDRLDGEPLRMVATIPPPTRGARLLDDGNWVMPEVKPAPVPQPPKLETGGDHFYADHERVASAMRSAAKLKDLGYRSQVYRDVCVVFYDARWIPLTQWKQHMRTIFSATVLADL